MKTFRVLSWGLVLLMFLALFSACSNAQIEESQDFSQEEVEDESKVTQADDVKNDPIEREIKTIRIMNSMQL